GAAAGPQVLLVVPSLNLITARFGEALDPSATYDEALRKHFFEPLMKVLAAKASASPASLDLSPGRTNSASSTNLARRETPLSKESAPYPHSPIIREIVWAPKETILRKAKGSDNWPLTWADDDNLYTAYGDGNGFEPHVPGKLSLGLAKVNGSPPDFSGENLRAVSIEQKGEGKAGKKASGILMVDGVL